MTLMRTLSLVVLLLLAPIAWACSPRSIDTPQQLVQGATGIYHVRATSALAGAHLRFKVLSVLKGSPKSFLRLPGSFVIEGDPNDHPAPYNFVRPGGRHGNCFATTYKQGQDYLLFLKDGTPYWSPLAPTNEQLSGASDPWLLWVEAQLNTASGLTIRSSRRRFVTPKPWQKELAMALAPLRGAA